MPASSVFGVTLVLIAASAPTSPNRERSDVERSLATACRQFADDAHWRELIKCNQAWFDAHEEAVWRLQINPHGGAATRPSS